MTIYFQTNKNLIIIIIENTIEEGWMDIFWIKYIYIYFKQ